YPPPFPTGPGPPSRLSQPLEQPSRLCGKSSAQHCNPPLPFSQLAQAAFRIKDRSRLRTKRVKPRQPQRAPLRRRGSAPLIPGFEDLLRHTPFHFLLQKQTQRRQVRQRPWDRIVVLRTEPGLLNPFHHRQNVRAILPVQLADQIMPVASPAPTDLQRATPADMVLEHAHHAGL